MDIDVITYNPCEVKDLRFNRRQYRQAMDRGIYFEIPYSFMLQDSTMRKRIIQMSHLYHSIGKSMVNFLNGELSYKSEQNTTGYLVGLQFEFNICKVKSWADIYVLLDNLC